MSITDELRFYVCRLRDEGSIGMTCERNLLNTADRIDAEHEKAVNKALIYGNAECFANADDWLESHNGELAEHGWIRLPVDGDGVLIRVGDRIHNDRDAPVTVDMMVWRDGWEEIVTSNGVWIPIVTNAKLRHYKTPTIEDVLRKFYEDFDSIHGYGPDEKEVVEKYAKRLQIKEADE